MKKDSRFAFSDFRCIHPSSCKGTTSFHSLPFFAAIFQKKASVTILFLFQRRMSLTSFAHNVRIRKVKSRALCAFLAPGARHFLHLG
jgi:hypothetical protein